MRCFEPDSIALINPLADDDIFFIVLLSLCALVLVIIILTYGSISESIVLGREYILTLE
jgi:hypothetical protein